MIVASNERETAGMGGRSATKRAALGLAILALATLSATTARAASPAEDLADKFSRAANEQQRGRDEQDLLNRARQEAPVAERQPTRLPTINIGEPNLQDVRSLEKLRQDELQRISDKLRKASQQRTAPRAAPPVESAWKTEIDRAPVGEALPKLDTSSRSALGVPQGLLDTDDGRATVLMIMSPGDRGIRRANVNNDHKTGDPILCTPNGCFVSNGSAVPAKFFTVGRAFGFRATFGERAGACANQLGCVFRSVEIGDGPSFVQPVDMRVMIHDRREMKRVEADRSCSVTTGKLVCSKPIVANSYTMWIVPEAVARQAGPALLAKAVADGLGNSRSAESGQPVLR